MKKIVTQLGKFGPYNTIETLEDRYRVDGADLPFNVIGQGEISEVQDGDFPIIDSLPSQDDAAANIRQSRNELLKSSDWTQLNDSPVNKAAWAAYRQNLRDITKQQGFPYNVIFPMQP